MNAKRKKLRPSSLQLQMLRAAGRKNVPVLTAYFDDEDMGIYNVRRLPYCGAHLNESSYTIPRPVSKCAICTRILPEKRVQSYGPDKNSITWANKHITQLTLIMSLEGQVNFGVKYVTTLVWCPKGTSRPLA